MKRKNCVVGLKVQSKHSGRTGVIVVLEPLDYVGDLTLRVQWDATDYKSWVAPSDVRKVKEVAAVEPLKVGDKVQVLPFTVHESDTCDRVYVEAMLPTIGVVGEVIEVQDHGYRVYFKDTYATWSYCPQYLERVA